MVYKFYKEESCMVLQRVYVFVGRTFMYIMVVIENIDEQCRDF